MRWIVSGNGKFLEHEKHNNKLPRPPKDKVTIMKVCITGGTGFIGKRLVDSLATKDHQISLLSRKKGLSYPPSVTVVEGDLADENCDFGKFISGCGLIFHCAGEVSDVSRMRQVHVAGTRRLLDAAHRYASEANQKIHWVQLSSVGAYGPECEEARGIERIVTEETEENPIGEYETTKTQSDKLVREAAEDGLITFSMLRPTFVFGAGMRNQSLISMVKIIKKGAFFYIGKRGAIANYIHVDDVVDALILCGFDKRAIGQVYNLSNDCLLEEVVESIAASANIPAPKLRVPRDLAITMVQVIGKFIRLPLTLGRIKALISRTRYPSAKIYSHLRFKPKRYVPDAMKEL